MSMPQRNTPPDNPQMNTIYLDDGTNRQDAAPGFRFYDGAVWIDLGGA